jgi:hypothetical protein
MTDGIIPSFDTINDSAGSAANEPNNDSNLELIAGGEGRAQKSVPRYVQRVYLD